MKPTFHLLDEDLADRIITEAKIILTGGDTSANDAQPVGEIEGEAVPCHTAIQTRHGIGYRLVDPDAVSTQA